MMPFIYFLVMRYRALFSWLATEHPSFEQYQVVGENLLAARSSARKRWEYPFTIPPPPPRPSATPSYGSQAGFAARLVNGGTAVKRLGLLNPTKQACLQATSIIFIHRELNTVIFNTTDNSFERHILLILPTNNMIKPYSVFHRNHNNHETALKTSEKRSPIQFHV